MRQDKSKFKLQDKLINKSPVNTKVFKSKEQSEDFSEFSDFSDDYDSQAKQEATMYAQQQRYNQRMFSE